MQRDFCHSAEGEKSENLDMQISCIWIAPEMPVQHNWWTGAADAYEPKTL